MTERLRTWWLLGEELCRRLVAPKSDIANSDREIEAILRDSWLWSCGESFVGKVHAAWLESRCRRLVSRLWAWSKGASDRVGV
jgi:hypothetical protein